MRSPVQWATATRWRSHLLRASDLTHVALGELIDRAAQMRDEPDGWTGALQSASVACVFEQPTTRALSLEAAAGRLGMQPIRVRPEALPLVEPVDDVAILCSYVATLIARMPSHSTLERLAGVATVPVINAHSDDHDPCQALADLLTLRERFTDLEGLTVAYVGTVGAAANSLIESGALAAMNVRVACPPERGPSLAVRATAEALAELHGGSVTVSDDPDAAATGADAIYTAPWDAGDLPQERLRRYRVDGRLMHRAKPSAVFMHSLPAYRGEEVSALVLDGPHSVVWRQVENRLPAEQAAIYALVNSTREAAEPHLAPR